MSMVFTHLCFGSATRLLRGGGIALIALLFAGCVSDQSGTREIFYRKSDLASYQDTVNSVIVARGTPPRLNCCLATLAWAHGLARAVFAVSARVLLGFQRHRARRYGIRAGRSGSVTVIQRFGGGLNLNVHSTRCCSTASSSRAREGVFEFRPLPLPTDDEVGGVLARIAARVQRLLRRRGLDPSEADVVQADPLVDESPAGRPQQRLDETHNDAIGPERGRDDL